MYVCMYVCMYVFIALEKQVVAASSVNFYDEFDVQL